MLTNRYMTSVKNLSAILQKIVEGAAPPKFTISHLKGLGFSSSNDVGVLALLKDLGFLTSDGVPTPRYHAYRDRSQSARVLGEAVREAYSDLFLINEKLSERDRAAVEGKFKQVHNSTDRVAGEQAKTFFALLKLADMPGATQQHPPEVLRDNPQTQNDVPQTPNNSSSSYAEETRQHVNLGGAEV